MTTYNRVLIALDLYGSPEQVLAKAAALVDRGATNIYLLNVFFDPTYIPAGYMGIGAYQDVYPEIDGEKARKAIENKMHTLAKEAGIPSATVIVESGRAASIIVEQAQQLKVDLLIVGSHGRHGLDLLLGSTANAVLHKATCDVLAVRVNNAS